MITEEEISGDETEHVVICDCGSELVFGIFEICHFHWVSLDDLCRLWANTYCLPGQAREGARAKETNNNLKEMVRRELDVEAQGSGKAQQGTAAIDTELK